VISVEIPTILRTYTGGERTVSVDGPTLAAVVTSLEAAYPGIGDRLVDGGALRRFVNVYLNDEDVRFLDGINTAVSDGDTVTILPAVAGGSGSTAVR
jgi:molybdopterin synthase sulfur carrier subunit